MREIYREGVLPIFITYGMEWEDSITYGMSDVSALSERKKLQIWKWKVEVESRMLNKDNKYSMELSDQRGQRNDGLEKLLNRDYQTTLCVAKITWLGDYDNE